MPEVKPLIPHTISFGNAAMEIKKFLKFEKIFNSVQYFNGMILSLAHLNAVTKSLAACLRLSTVVCTNVE